MGELAGGIIGGVGALTGGLMGKIGADEAASAQLQASREQVDFAREALQKSIDERNRGVALAQDTAKMSPGEIQQIQSLLQTKTIALNANMATVQKQQDLLDAAAPNVKAAGQQLYDVLAGQAADNLGPLQAMRDRQRQEMENQMASRLGPGWRTSSAGIEASMKFEDQSLSMKQQVITQATQNFTSLFGQQFQGQNAVTQNTGNMYNQSLNADLGALQGEQVGANRLTNAVTSMFTGNPVNFNGVVNAQQSVVNASANTGAGNAVFGNMVGGIGANILGNSFGQSQATSGLFSGFGNGSVSSGGGLGVDTNLSGVLNPKYMAQYGGPVPKF